MILQAQPPLFYQAQGNTFNTFYQDYLDQIIANGEKPGPFNIQAAQNRFVNNLVISGLWTRMKTGYFFHTGSIGAGLVNLKAPSTYQITIEQQTAIVPIFLQGVGTRVGATGYFNQPFKSNEYAGIESDLTVIQYMPYEPFGSEYPVNAFACGFDVTAAAGTDRQIAILPFTAAGTGNHRRATGTAHTFTSNTHQGLYVATYDGANAVMYKDGTKTSAAVTPIAPNNSINRFIFAANDDGSPLTRYARLIAADFLFDRFDDTDEATFRSIWTDYITEININFQYVAEYASHCWFTRNKSAYDAGTNLSWMGQCHNDAFNVNAYSQYIIQIDNDTNTLSKFKLGTVTQQDDHNEPSIVIRASDSRLFCIYSEHGGAVLRWRISTNPLDASAWGAEQTLDPEGNTTHVYTYPSAFEAANGDIFVFYRAQDIPGVNGWAYSKSTDGGATFSGYTAITSITYSAIAQDPNNKDILHFITTYHPDDAAPTNNYVSHFYFDCSTETLHQSDGTDVTANIPLDHTDMTTIYTALIASNEDCWLEDIIVDGSGNPRVLFTLIPDMPTALLKDEYYSEWNGSAWSTPHLLHRSATHYMETELLATNLQSIWYAPNGSFDRANPNRIFSSVETAGYFGDVCEIWELNRLSSSNFTRLQRTFNSDKDQWRPFTIESPTNNVFWLNKFYYDHWLDLYFQTLVLRTY